MGWGLGSFLESVVGKENVDAGRKLWNRTADGVDEATTGLGNVANEAAAYATQKAKEIEAYRRDNLRAQAEGDPWWNNAVEGPQTQYQAMVAADSPLEGSVIDPTMVTASAFKAGGKLANVANTDGLGMIAAAREMAPIAMKGKISLKAGEDLQLARNMMKQENDMIRAANGKAWAKNAKDKVDNPIHPSIAKANAKQLLESRMLKNHPTDTVGTELIAKDYLAGLMAKNHPMR